MQRDEFVEKVLAKLTGDISDDTVSELRRLWQAADNGRPWMDIPTWYELKAIATLTGIDIREMSRKPRHAK